MKRTLVVLVIVSAVLIVGDLFLRAAAEKAAARLIDKKIPQRVEPTVRLGGSPFLLSMFRGNFDEVTVSIPSAREDVLVVDDIRLTFADVRLEALEVLAGRGDLRAEGLRGRGTISEETLNKIMVASAPGVTVAIEDGSISVAREGVEVAATAVVASDTIFIKAGEVGPIEIPLPDLLPDVRFSSLEPRRDELVLGIHATDVRIRI